MESDNSAEAIALQQAKLSGRIDALAIMTAFFMRKVDKDFALLLTSAPLKTAPHAGATAGEVALLAMAQEGRLEMLEQLHRVISDQS